jgi:hypothetical protein
MDACKLEIAMVKVYIEGYGVVTAQLIQRYADGDVRVRLHGVEYVCKEAV